MAISELDPVVLRIDLGQHGLKAGDVGSVVMVYSSDRLEVEFVIGNGHTRALMALNADSVRPLGANEILSARQLDAA